MIVLNTLWLVQHWLGRASRRVARSEEGATLVEYGLLVALIAVICMATVATLGGNIKAMFCQVANQITSGSC